jgi:DNA gyrase subunit A
MRARYVFDKQNSCIEIIQIPYSTTIEAIIKAVGDLVRDGKIKEITDFRDEIDLSGFKLTLDVRRGTDPDALMAKLFKMTPLEDSFACNFNVLIDGAPRQMGVGEILTEWIRFRQGCVVRELTFELNKKKEKLHLLRALGKILLDIDKAIRIVRETAKEADVVPNLMSGFRIDQVQAEYIAEIKLRHLYREYILERIKEIESLQKEIADLEDLIGDDLKQKALIAAQLGEIKKKFGKPRKTQLIYPEDIKEAVVENTVENYNVHIVLTKDGYFKKITHQSLRMSDDHKLKDGDIIITSEDTENRAELLIFTDRAQAYKPKLDDFSNTKASALGDFLPAVLDFDEDERPVMLKALTEYNPEHHIIFIFANGKGVRVPVTAYETKTNRRKLSGAFSDISPIVAVFYEEKPMDILLISDAGKAILINSSMIAEKTTRTAAGVTLFTLKAGQSVVEAAAGESISAYEGSNKCRKLKLPAVGVTLAAAESGKKQLSLG